MKASWIRFISSTIAKVVSPQDSTSLRMFSRLRRSLTRTSTLSNSRPLACSCEITAESADAPLRLCRHSGLASSRGITTPR